MLVHLLYASRSSKPVTCELVESILVQCRNNNPPQGITGILCYSGDTFMQILEGGRKEVCSLYNNIVQDPRHGDIELLHFSEISERCFSSWTMGQVNLSKVNPSTTLKYSEKAVLDPFSSSGKASMALLAELIATASIVGRGG